MEEGRQISARVEHEERTSVLANERTYSAWIRTGLTTFATGLVFVVVLFLVGVWMV